MEKEKRISKAVIRRLPRYYRYLGDLLSQGITRISSKALSERMNVTASQIRQDLNCFGGFGQQGYGYNVEYLYEEIGSILGIDTPHPTVIVGAGHIGTALANYTKFEKRGFVVCGVFDADKSKIGTKVHDIEVMPMESLVDFCKDNNVDIGIIAVPHDSARKVAQQLIEGGVKGLLNFTYEELHFDGIAVENVHLTDSLMTLSYGLTNL